MDIGQYGSTLSSAEPPHPSSCPTTQSASLRLVPVHTNSKPQAWKGRRFQRGFTTCVLGGRCSACVYDNPRNLRATKLPCCCGGCAVAHPGITRIGLSYAQWDLSPVSGCNSIKPRWEVSWAGFGFPATLLPLPFPFFSCSVPLAPPPLLSTLFRFGPISRQSSAVLHARPLKAATIMSDPASVFQSNPEQLRLLVRAVDADRVVTVRPSSLFLVAKCLTNASSSRMLYVVPPQARSQFYHGRSDAPRD